MDAALRSRSFNIVEWAKTQRRLGLVPLGLDFIPGDLVSVRSCYWEDYPDEGNNVGIVDRVWNSFGTHPPYPDLLTQLCIDVTFESGEEVSLVAYEFVRI